MRIFLPVLFSLGALLGCDPVAPDNNNGNSNILVVDDMIFGDLVITEFVADAAVGCADGDGEWIEIYNDSGMTVNLDGLRIEDYQGNVTRLGQLYVANGGYTMVGKGPGANWCWLEATPDAFYASSFYLNNNGPETLILRKADGTVIDDMPVWQDLGTVEGSVALDDRYIDAWSNDDAWNWYYTATCTPSEPFGSPGMSNLTCDL